VAVETRTDAEAERFTLLARVFDPTTIRRLDELGVDRGWRCLEVGAGSGSIARWLGMRVGSPGSVLATELDTARLGSQPIPHVQVLEHDIVADPLPEAAFDLAHARFVLMRLPEREHALARIALAVRPGGWVVVEEMDLTTHRSGDGIETYDRVQEALRAAAASSGCDVAYGAKLGSQLEGHGLVDVEAEGRTAYSRSRRGPGQRLLRHDVERQREAIVATGIVGETDVDEVLRLLDEPAFAAWWPTVWTAWGRRPD
jgi:SAM-dependent methyltransferase